MKTVTIRRCPSCSTIKSHTDQLQAALKNNPDMNVKVVDGGKGEFRIDVDGRSIDGVTGENLRSADEIAAEVRGEQAAAV